MSKATRIILTIVSTIVLLGIELARYAASISGGTRHPNLILTAAIWGCYFAVLGRIWQRKERSAGDITAQIKEREKEAARIMVENSPKKKKFEIPFELVVIVLILVLIWAVVTLWPEKENAGFSYEDLKKTEKSDEKPLPADWKLYTFNGTYSITVPPTVELRGNDDSYTQEILALGATMNQGKRIFQQKGLSNHTEGSEDLYCRIMLSLIPGEPGDFVRPDQKEFIDSETRTILDAYVQKAIGPNAVEIGKHSIYWFSVGDINALRIDYKRSGDKHRMDIPVVGTILMMQNYDKMVTMVLAYREAEAYLWKDDFEAVIQSFKWLKND